MNQELRINFLKTIKVLTIIILVFCLFIIANTPIANAHGTRDKSATDSSKINYTLPYPGLLPDSPLYFLKATREKISSFFISDPVKKAEFDLLQADKRIEASRLLIKKDKSKIDLARSTLSKGENYFESAINRTQDAKSQGVEVSSLSSKMVSANQKHHAVMDEMIQTLTLENKEKFAVEQERMINLGKKAKELSK